MSEWKYCTPAQCREMLLSFRLLGENGWSDDKVMACLYALGRHAELHYEQVRIPKKGGGTRKLLVPDPLLKNVQRGILHRILDGRRPADSAAAYRAGASVSANARLHTGRSLVLKMDIEDFFGSITFPMVQKSAFPSQYFPPSVGTLLTSLCCYRECLPQGAPCSPAISNLVMRPFDIYMEKWCGERGITYSRYCDDMTFSGDFDAGAVKRKVYGYLHAMGFEPNRKKTRILTRGNRQTVTGIVVNEKPQVSREYRRKLRQEVHFCQRFGVQGHLEKLDDSRYPAADPAARIRYLQALLGKINYVLQVNKQDNWFSEAKAGMGELMMLENAAMEEEYKAEERTDAVIMPAYDALDQIRILFEEYTKWLGINLEFQHYEDEINGLPGKYGAPEGGLYLLYYGEMAAGCGAFRKLDGQTCEFKRLYIRPQFRGHHLGTVLMKRLMDDARAAGYSKGRLDTLSTMDSAVGLYGKMGFVRISPYYENPLEHAQFYEADL